jgi:hypothetical protein
MMGPSRGAKASRQGYTRASVALAHAPEPERVRERPPARLPVNAHTGHARVALLPLLCGWTLCGLGLLALLSAAVALGVGDAGEWPWLCALLAAAVAGFQVGRLTSTLPWL